MPAAPLSFGKDKELAGKLEVPLCLLPAKGDPGESLHEVMQTKPLGSRCVQLLPICWLKGSFCQLGSRWVHAVRSSKWGRYVLPELELQQPWLAWG